MGLRGPATARLELLTHSRDREHCDWKLLTPLCHFLLRPREREWALHHPTSLRHPQAHPRCLAADSAQPTRLLCSLHCWRRDCLVPPFHAGPDVLEDCASYLQLDSSTISLPIDSLRRPHASALSQARHHAEGRWQKTGGGDTWSCRGRGVVLKSWQRGTVSHEHWSRARHGDAIAFTIVLGIVLVIHDHSTAG
ncbi:unnamed protein product [Lampetra fluviatilis]